MNTDEQIRALEAKLAELKAQQSQGNQLGFYAKKTCTEQLKSIKVMVDAININTSEEKDITAAFSSINRSSWTALKAIERDAQERA